MGSRQYIEHPWPGFGVARRHARGVDRRGPAAGEDRRGRVRTVSTVRAVSTGRRVGREAIRSWRRHRLTGGTGEPPCFRGASTLGGIECKTRGQGGCVQIHAGAAGSLRDGGLLWRVPHIAHWLIRPRVWTEQLLLRCCHMEVPKCTCGHSWIWHDADEPSKCEYGECSCQHFTDASPAAPQETPRQKPAGKPTTDDRR